MSTQRRKEKSARVCGREEGREGGREREPFGSSFYMFFFLPLGLPYVNWAGQECCLFYLRSSLWSLDLPLFYFCGLFPSLSFSHRHSGTPVSYSNCLIHKIIVTDIPIPGRK